MKLFVIIVLSVFYFVACQSNNHSNQMHSTENNSNKPVLGKDLVCGMDVTDSTYVADYEGKTYFFCAEHCKEEFQKEPQKYLSKK